MSELIEKAKEIMDTLNLDQLARSAFRRDIKTKSDSHCTVTYPERITAYSIDPEDIFSRTSGTKDLALYLHIPFCQRKCTYCQYPVFSNYSNEKIDRYLAALIKEIDLASELSGVKNSRISTTYVGGGTPTYLSPINLEKLFKHVRKRFNFSKNIEFTVEASPETILEEIGKEKLNILRKYGVNRLSLGVQTFNDKILSFVNRVHNSKQAIVSIQIAKENFDKFNIDLILGLPDQTLEVIESDLAISSSLRIPSITLYPLTIKPEATIYSLFEKEPQRFHDERTFMWSYIMAMEYFAGRGYKEYPIWWFTSSPKYVYQQQIHKWEDNGELLALGIKGYSYINNVQYHNFGTLKEYFESLDDDRLPVWKGARLPTLEEQARRNMIFGIRCKIDKGKFKNKYGFFPEEKFGEELNRLKELNLITNSEKEIKLTNTGKLFSEEIVRKFVEGKNV